MPKQSIYIADDDDNIREGIKLFLENEEYSVTDFTNGDGLLEKFRENPCDLVILDIMLPGSDGFAICQNIRKLSTVPIIMLSARDSEFDYAKGISLGSDDYFTKPFSPMALVMRVKAIFRRIDYEKQKNGISKSENLIFQDITIDTGAKQAEAKGKELALSPNEFEMLSYLVLHAGQAVSRKELLNYIWGIESEIETRAADDTVRRLRRKLECSNVLIEAVWGFGFRLIAKKSS